MTVCGVFSLFLPIHSPFFAVLVMSPEHRPLGLQSGIWLGLIRRYHQEMGK